MPLRGPTGALIIGDANTVTKKILYINEALGGISRITFQMGVSTLASREDDACDRNSRRQRRPHGARRAFGECSMSEPRRCAWAESDPLLRAYHDRGVGSSRARQPRVMGAAYAGGIPGRSGLDHRVAQARRVPQSISRLRSEDSRSFGEKDITRLLGNPGIIRSRAKIEATIQGARIYEADEARWRELR